MATVPQRRDAAGVDKAADLSRLLASIPILSGQLLTIQMEYTAGNGWVRHNLGRAYTGAFIVSLGSENIAPPDGTFQVWIHQPSTARGQGLDPARYVLYQVCNHPGGTYPVTVWIF